MAKGGAAYFPNHVLLTQDNQPVRFYDDLLKNKIVLINFLFTTCKGACSPMTANLAKVQQQLGAHLGKEVVMLSLSVDPETDTPAALKKYAESFKAQPGWYFLTGKKENLDWVLYKLGNYVEDKNQHGLKLIVGNEATGEWMKLHAMSNPTEIAAAVLKLLPKAADAK
jgi:cytochrome oxidase Cu insertion factor (SCO1/SenC/PrrC family)